MTETQNQTEWGRVADDGTVYVRESAGERPVGSYPDSTPKEALAYFVRKFEDLNGQVTLLEARVARGTASGNVTESVAKLQKQLEEPAVVGDIDSLRERVAKLDKKAAEFVEQQKAEREAARAAAIAEREEIVAEAERIAGQPDDKIRWKESGVRFDELFKSWQASQRRGPQLPKSVADPLWKRFRAARHKFEIGRRHYFAKLDSRNKTVRNAKEKLIAQAEALAEQGAAGIPSYRSLLSEWKKTGRSTSRIDNQLWDRFKAAGDVLYGARKAELAELDEEFGANLKAKEELLAEAKQLLNETDHAAARKALTGYQLRWDEIGRVPRDAVSRVEGEMRSIENHVKQLEEDHWRATDPETKARSEGLRGQLEASIAELESEIAKGGKNTAELEEKLSTQRSWLAALDG